MTTQAQRKTRGGASKRAAPTAQYDAGGNGRRLKGWSPPSAGPNRALKGLSKIRARAQDAVRNDWSGESSVQKWTTALIGVGITPRWDDESLADLWLRWGRVADADGVLDIYGMQALGIRSVLAAGEVFVRRRPRPLSFGLPVPLQVQLIESDFCPVFDSDQWPGMSQGNTIRQGIELTRYGERAAYWMYKQHPGDGPSAPTQDQLIRIPAREIRHVYEVKRPGQLRGVSSLAPILVRLRSTGDFEDAVLDRQKLANLFTLFITRQMPESWDDIDIDSETGLPKFYDKDGSPMAGLEPGIAQELKPGEDVKFANPPEAGVTFSDYLRTTNLGTASGQGLPYELFSGDIQNVSDRTLRVVIQEFRRFAEQRQWHMVIPMMCQPIVEWFADAGVLAGEIPLSKLAAAKSPEHSPHGWDYIHPVQDVEGKVLAIQNGLSSRTRAITARGDDPKKIDAERAEDQKREKALGIEPPPAPGAAKPGAPAAKPAEGDEPPTKPAQNAELMQIMSTMTQMMGAMQALVGHVTAMATQQPTASAPAAAPSFVVNNHLPAPVVNVEPTPVTIEPTVVNVAAPEVNVSVEPTPVTIEPTVVNVAAPEVNVVNEVQPAEVSVSLPARETTSVIKRNAAGEIVDVKQTERTIN